MSGGLSVEETRRGFDALLAVALLDGLIFTAEGIAGGEFVGVGATSTGLRLIS